MCGPGHEECSLLLVLCNAKTATGQGAQPRSLKGVAGGGCLRGAGLALETRERLTRHGNDCCTPRKLALTAGLAAENGEEVK